MWKNTNSKKKKNLFGVDNFKKEEENCFNEKETKTKFFFISLISLQFVWNFATHRKSLSSSQKAWRIFSSGTEEEEREGENLNFLIVLYNSTIE